MSAHMQEPLSLSRLAREGGVSRDHLLRLFRRDTGQTPCATLKKMRMREAARLFAMSPELSVKEVAAKVGLPDRAHFSRAFKALVGVDPSGYRKAAARRNVPAFQATHLGAAAALAQRTSASD